jgi:fibronectin-binding autotransporter adhesin
MRTGTLLGVMLALLLSSAVNGQTWDGGGSTNNWTDGVNWNANVAPVNNGTASINFAGSTRLAPFVNVNFDVRRMSFDTTAGAFTIGSGGAVLTVREGGITSFHAGVTQTIAAPLTVGSSQTWNGDGSLTASAPVNLSTNTLTLDTPATFALSNTVVGAGAIVKEGTGAVLLSGLNTFSGGLTLNQGTLGIANNSGLGTGAFTINGGNIEAVSSSRTLTNSVVVNQDFSIVSGVGLTLSGPITMTESRTLTNGITDLAFSGALGEDAPGRELTLSGGGKLTLSGAALTLGTSLKLTAGTLTATGLINGAGHTLTQTGGTFTGSLINRGTFVYSGGVHSGNLANEAGADATINANLTLTAALNNLGTVRVASGRILTFGAQPLNNMGTMELAGGTLSANASPSFASSGQISGFGSISLTATTFSNSGQIDVAGGNLTLASNSSFSNSGTISVPSRRQLVWNSAATFGNSGLIQLSGGSLTGTGSITNSGAGEIRGGGSVQAALANSGGLVHASGAAPLTIVNFAGGNTNGGEVRVDDGATMNISNTFSSSGSIVLGGVNASLNVNAVTNTGTLRGHGRMSGAALNSGVIRAEGGTLTLAGIGNTNAAGGRLEAGTGTQLVYAQGLATNAGLIAITGGAFDNNNLAINNSGRIEGYGTVRTGGLTNSGAISVAGALDVLGAVTNNGSVNTTTGATVRFFGPVNGPGNYTGTGTVVFLNSFSPGASPAAVSFGGDVDLTGTSTLFIELAGMSSGSQFDTLAANGAATLGGVLDVELLGGFTPAPGSVFQIVSAAGGVGGLFSDATLPSLVGANWQLRYESNAVLLQVALTGDYNFDGRVDAADYTLWRNSLGQSGIGLAADGDGDRQVDSDDYAMWKTHFGEAIGSGSGGQASSPSPPNIEAVPEPRSCIVLFVSALVAVAMLWRPTVVSARRI